MKYLKYLFLTFCFLFWPVSLILNNPSNWFIFVFSGLLICLSLFLFSKSSSKLKILSLVILIIALLSTFREISKNSIWKFDPLAYDTQVKKVGLIPNRTLARVVQNKFIIYLDKFTSNVFLILDTNNYFFSLHPRETGNTQNLNKFPYIALPLFLVGLYLFATSRKKFLFTYFFTATIFLSLMANSDKYDFLLWPFIFFSIAQGADYLLKKHPQIAIFYFSLGLPIIIFDFVRIFFLNA